LRQRPRRRTLNAKIDLWAYVRAFGLLARNPQIVLAPLLAAVAQVLLFMVVPLGGGGIIGDLTQSVVSLLSSLIAAFGLAVAIAGSDEAWTRGRAPFENAYTQAKRHAGDIIVAAIGYSFLVYIGGLVGGSFGDGGSLIVSAVVTVLCIYMLPAATIGGIPGGATLNVSVERVRAAPLSAIVVAVVYFFSLAQGPALIVMALEPLRFSSSMLASGVVSSLIVALAKAVVWAYVALVLTKAYNDASYGRFRRY
jgi:hypothetical protein